jgi:hypothetical protein
MKPLILLVLITLLLPLTARARLGETEPELIARFGRPVGRSKTFAFAQGHTIPLGPEIVFQQDDWTITCDLIDERCARIGYHKRGDWTDNQILTVLTANAQGAKWSDITKPANRYYVREWKREDGAIAHWQRGLSMTITTPAFERAEMLAKEKAKVKASQIPNL